MVNTNNAVVTEMVAFWLNMTSEELSISIACSKGQHAAKNCSAHVLDASVIESAVESAR